MQFSGTCNLTGSFCNESFVGKFCENLQRNMRLSATHRMPPAKKSRSQHVKHLKPIFSKYSVYARFYVLCAAHIECRQKHIQMSSFCCKISVFYETHGCIWECPPSCGCPTESPVFSPFHRRNEPQTWQCPWPHNLQLWISGWHHPRWLRTWTGHRNCDAGMAPACFPPSNKHPGESSLFCGMYLKLGWEVSRWY